MIVFMHVHSSVYVCVSVLHLGRVKELSGQITSLPLLGFLCLSVSAQMKICSTQITRVPSHRFLGNPSCLKPLAAVLFIVREFVRAGECLCLTIGDAISVRKAAMCWWLDIFFGVVCLLHEISLCRNMTRASTLTRNNARSAYVCERVLMDVHINILMWFLCICVMHNTPHVHTLTHCPYLVCITAHTSTKVAPLCKGITVRITGYMCVYIATCMYVKIWMYLYGSRCRYIQYLHTGCMCRFNVCVCVV